MNTQSLLLCPTLHDPILIPHFCALQRLAKYTEIVTPVLSICIMPSGEEARNSMTFSIKAQQHSVAGQLILALGGAGNYIGQGFLVHPNAWLC